MDTEQKLDLILNELQKTNTHLHGIEDTIGVMKQDIAELKTEVTELKTDVAKLKTEVADIKVQQTEMKKDIADLKMEVADIKVQQKAMKQDISALYIVLEQNIQKQIQIIAEGHQVILRQLLEMQARYNQYENLAIEVQVHDYRINEIKRHLSLA